MWKMNGIGTMAREVKPSTIEALYLLRGWVTSVCFAHISLTHRQLDAFPPCILVFFNIRLFFSSLNMDIYIQREGQFLGSLDK